MQHHRNTPGRQIQQSHQQRRQNQHRQGGGNPREKALHQPQHGHAEQGHQQGGHLGGRQLGKDLDQPRPNPTGRDLKSQHLADLPQKNRQGDSVEESHQDRFGQKISQCTQAKGTGQQAKHAGKQRECRGEGEVKGRIASGQGSHGGGKDGAAGGIGVHHQLW